METPTQGASTEEAQTGNSSTEQTDESGTTDTSTDGQQEDADTLKKRLADKDAHIVKLETELREKKPPKKGEPEDADDVMTWMTLNADNLKLVPKEFQEELTFYKSHKIPVTNEIRDRALRDARARKGVRNTEAERQTSTSTETQGEMRKTTSNPTEVPEHIAKLAKEGGTELTPERYAKYRPEIEERRKKRG